MWLKLVVLAQFVLFLESAYIRDNTFELSIIHFNDFHARIEPTNEYTPICKSNETNCVGGVSKLYSAIMKLKFDNPNAIVLNAGDNFQGSLWYTVYKWKAIAHFLNKLPVDAQTLGNHEFDDKIEGVIPYLRHVNVPTVVSNIDDTDEPDFQNLYKKSIIIRRSGIKIGVIGATTPLTMKSARPGKLKFLNPLESVNKEARRLVAEENVDTIIVLSHCGYYEDQNIARNSAPKVGLVVGGHSHSLLYNGIPPDNLTVHGPYPTVVAHEDGRNILVVQAFAYTRFIGDITVRYSNDGGVLSWSGKPIYLNKDELDDGRITQEIAEWKTKVDEYGSKTLGVSLVKLDRSKCKHFECNIGSFIADAMVYAYITNEENAWTYASIAIINSGAIRKSINIGEITVGDILEALPFENTIDIGELQGKYIKESMEYAALPSYGSKHLLQVSGLHVVYNVTNRPGSMVQSIKVRCRVCDVPKYENLEMEKFYRVALVTFLVHGGDGFSVISTNLLNHKVGRVSHEVVQEYVAHQSPIVQSVEDRIIILQ